MAQVQRLVRAEEVIPAQEEQVIPAVFETVVLVSKETAEKIRERYFGKDFGLIGGWTWYLTIIPTISTLGMYYAGTYNFKHWSFKLLTLYCTIACFAYFVTILAKLRYILAHRPTMREILLNNGWDGEGPTPKWEVESSNISAECDDVELLDQPIDFGREGQDV